MYFVQADESLLRSQGIGYAPVERVMEHKLQDMEQHAVCLNILLQREAVSTGEDNKIRATTRIELQQPGTCLGGQNLSAVPLFLWRLNGLSVPTVP